MSEPSLFRDFDSQPWQPPSVPLSREDRAAARRAAAWLLSRYESECGVIGPPVPVREIAERVCGLTFWDQSLDEYRTSRTLLGTLLVYRRTIVLHSGDTNICRRRFTVAHELGHWLLHRGLEEYLAHRSEDDLPRLKEVRRAMETQADEFAANLLIPLRLLRRTLRQVDATNTSGVLALSREFDVSRTAMGIRVERLATRKFVKLHPSMPSNQLRLPHQEEIFDSATRKDEDPTYDYPSP